MGAVYGIDHYVVPTADTARWSSFYTDVFGAVLQGDPNRPGTKFTFVGKCHVGGSPSRVPMTPGAGLPRYSWYVRKEEIADHLARLDANGVAHTAPIRTAEEGEEGTAIRFADPDGNQLELWAPERMPDGAMAQTSSVGVGHINAATYESRDLDRSVEFYGRYCGLQALSNADIADDTAVLPLAGVGRIVLKRVDRLGNRTTGHAIYRALHTALMIPGEEFMPSMDRMWRELPEWDFDPNDMPTLSAEEAGAMPARTCIHGSPIGPHWKQTIGRGDSFVDWDTNVFHLVAGEPIEGSSVLLSTIEQEHYLEGQGIWSPERAFEVTVCISVDGTASYTGSGPSNEILIGTVGGVLFLTRSSAGAPWTESRRTLEGKHVSALVPGPRAGQLFAGVYKDGFYVSNDSGHTWERKCNGMEFTDVYGVSAVEDGGELRVYAGTEPAHLYVSRDFGESWEELPALRSVSTVDKWTFPAPPHIGHVKHITFDPRSADVIYASVEVGGALKSEDGGRTWRDLPGVYEDVHRVVIPPTQPDVLFTTGGRGVWQSTNAGNGWINLSRDSAGIVYPDGFVLHPDDPDLMFTSGSFCSPFGWRETHTANSRIARSRDGGETWERLGGGLPDNMHGNFEALMMQTWPGGFALTAGNTDGEVYYSEDQGETWSKIADGIPAMSKSGHYRNIGRPDQPVAAGAH